jgi:hypothetical protein
MRRIYSVGAQVSVVAFQKCEIEMRNQMRRDASTLNPPIITLFEDISHVCRLFIAHNEVARINVRDNFFGEIRMHYICLRLYVSIYKNIPQVWVARALSRPFSSVFLTDLVQCVDILLYYICDVEKGEMVTVNLVDFMSSAQPSTN